MHELLEVRFDLGQARVVGSFERDPRRALGIQQFHHALNDVVDVDRREVELAVRTQDAVDEVPQPVRFGDDHAGVLALVTVELPVQQLSGAAKYRPADS